MKRLSLFSSLVGLVIGLTFSSCNPDSKVSEVNLDNPKLIHQAEQALTDVIVHDIFSPPVASRIYAYANLAAYEALVHQYPSYTSMKGVLNEFEGVSKPDASKEYSYSLASIKAFITVGKALIFSENKINQFENQLFDSLRRAVPKTVFMNSMEYGDQVAKDVLAYAKKDNYAQTRGFRYTIMEEEGIWKPTPPAYLDAVEPFWNKIRPFILDSAGQFAISSPFNFSLTEGSGFYNEVMEVYEVGKNLTMEQREIASFWDCNPFAMNVVGHAMYALKKISPGGHWIGITGIANQLSKADMMKSVDAYLRVSVALADGFISCWDEKYRRNLIRPETVINAYYDESWNPVLQTPPFPEYPSGHSVISTAAAIVLTDIYGDNFQFVDSTEVRFGLPPRSFNSFVEASQEAAISRLYGGIHYRSAINDGIEQGKQVGALVVDRLNPKKEVAVK